MIYIFVGIISLNLFFLSEKININFFNEKNNRILTIFIFSLIFPIIYLISSYFFLLEISTYYIINILFYFFIALSFIFWRDFIKLTQSIKKIDIKYKLLLIITFFIYLFVFLPLSDEDAIRYHLEIGRKINQDTFYNYIWFDYITISSEEFLNSFFLNLKFENISGVSNFIYLIFILISNIYFLNRYKVGSGFASIIILLSSPYFFQLLSSQKFYLLPCYIVTYSIVYLYFEKKISLSFKIIIIILNLFCVITKPIFLPYFLISLFLIFRATSEISQRFKIIFLCCFGFFIFYFPIFVIKNNIFGDPFIPYFSLNSENTLWLKEYYFWLKDFNMDTTDRIFRNDIETESTLIGWLLNKIKLYLMIIAKLFFPLRPSDLFKTIGIGLIYLFLIDYKKYNNLKYLIISFILAVVLIDNYQTRWFLPLFLLVIIFAEINKFKLVKIITFISFFCVSSAVITIGLFSFLINTSVINKKLVYPQIIDAYRITDQINMKYKNKNIYTSMNYFYFLDNYIPIYYPDIFSKFKKDYYKSNNNEENLILWDEGRYGKIQKFVNDNFRCKKLEIIENYEYNSRRFKWNRLIKFIDPKTRLNDKKIKLYRFNC